MDCRSVLPLICLVVSFLRYIDAGCSGVKNLPLQMGNPNTKIKSGNRQFLDKDVASLARSLKSEITGLSLKYTLRIAENALESDEEFEQTYHFCLNKNKATLSQYEITTKKQGGAITVKWRIAEVSMTFKAQREITVHARRRRKFWSGRRRCSKVYHQRGVTKAEIAKIRNKLNGASNRRIATRRRMSKRRYLGDEQQCPTTVTRPKRPIIDRCLRKVGPRIHSGYRNLLSLC